MLLAGRIGGRGVQVRGRSGRFSSGGAGGGRRHASTLVVADHNNKAPGPGTLNAISAAGKLGGDVTVLVAGNNASPVAELLSKTKGKRNRRENRILIANSISIIIMSL